MSIEKHPQIKRRPIYQRIVKYMWIAFGVAFVGFIAFLWIISLQDLPTFDQLENPKDNWASELYFANGDLIGRYYVENRVPVEFDELSDHVVKALIATEDERYYSHSGIDAEALARVMVKTVILQQRSKGGGSTITQQLAKLLYSDRNFAGMNKLEMLFALGTRKMKEWITAVKLEKAYTKEEIISMYLNHFDFINGAYGIRAASEIYFGKKQDSLHLDEAAVLVGMLKNPSYYNPRRFPQNARQRRNVVFKQMVRNGHLTQEEYDSLRSLPIDMSNFKRATHSEGPAPHFRMVLRSELPRILAREECLKSDSTVYDIYRDGLKIYTTLDPVIQDIAEKAVLKHMPELQETFWRRWRNLDPWTYKDPETTDQELEIRQATLKRLIRESDRYKNMYQNYIGEPLQLLEESLGTELNFRNYDFDRLVKAHNDRSYITELRSANLVPAEKASLYRKILKHKKWPPLLEGWQALEKAVEESFKKEVPMKVFAYNGQMEKDTVMTPLDSIKYHRMFLQIGSIAVDPSTGYVKSWVGGINHKYFKYDHVTSNRQVGSTFKPFIYATAIAQQGMSPCYEIYDIQYSIKPGDKNFNLIEPWSPSNASGEFTGELYNLFRGLKYSKNSVSVKLMYELGDTEPVRELVDNMGLSKEAKYTDGRYKIPKQPSICLGSTDLTVLELTGAYTTFANNGVFNKPVYISRIENREGKVIYEAIPEEKIALSPQHNYVMVELLRYAAAGSAGFGGVKTTFGGKTGTTNDYVDGWYIGITPNLVIGTWVGGEDRWIRFRSLTYGSGAKMARPYFASMLKQLEESPESQFDPEMRFYRPPGELGIELDCAEYKREGLDEPAQEDPDFYEDFFADELGELPKPKEEKQSDRDEEED